jgi:hypothetical protein
MNFLYTHMSCHGFFLVGDKEFASLLITDYTSTVNRGIVLIESNSYI